ncbi:MAG: OST-HTH/LOTUS domain-containing protein, partial [Burkholderiales bacterium]|nr:OST-HTH/LOTUS domain-containing protein [Burkholderiales bacterium]
NGAAIDAPAADASSIEPPVTEAAVVEGNAEGAPKSEEQKHQEALDLVMETIEALFEERGTDDKIWGSMVKQTLKRRRPGFNETYYGFGSFSKLLEEAKERKMLDLAHDEKSGGVIITGYNPDW